MSEVSSSEDIHDQNPLQLQLPAGLRLRWCVMILWKAQAVHGFQGSGCKS